VTAEVVHRRALRVEGTNRPCSAPGHGCEELVNGFAVEFRSPVEFGRDDDARQFHETLGGPTKVAKAVASFGSDATDPSGAEPVVDGARPNV
jgi:hypothetical protein